MASSSGSESNISERLRVAWRVLQILLGLFAISVFCGLCLIGVGWSAGIPFHNYKLRQYEQTFQQIRHPPGSELLVHKSEILQDHSTNDCAYVVGQLRSCGGLCDDIEQFYQKQGASNATLQDVEVLVVANGTLPADASWRLPPIANEVTYWIQTPTKLPDQAYIVYLYRWGSGLFDLRCH